MEDQRKSYRVAYRAAADRLDLYTQNRFTDAQKNAIMREAIRSANKRERFWLVVSLVATLVVGLAVARLHEIQTDEFMFAGFTWLLGQFFLAIRLRKTRMHFLRKEVMLILKRKRIRPDSCICCDAQINDDGSEECDSCGCPLAVDPL